MKIMVIGATGTIGKEIVKLLSAKHEIIKVGNTSGDFKVDLSERDSIVRLFQGAGEVDAVVSAAGQAKFGSLDELSDEDFHLSLHNKLMGQINLVRIGRQHIRDNGSFTLTSGVLAQHPMPGSAAISTVNAGLEGFVRAAALELERGVRVNVVSPGWVKETMEAMGMDSSEGTPAAQVALSYEQSVVGQQTGEVISAKKT